MASAAERLAAEIADLRRRLEGLERSASADLRSIDDGTLTAFDEGGQEVVLLGRQDDGTYGVQGKNGATIIADAAREGSITETEIADGSISTPKLQANAVTADVLAAEISLANKRFIAGDPAGERTEVNSTGFQSFDANGVETFRAAGGDVFLSGSVESIDYVEAEAGWRLDSQLAQFTNLNTIQELGADSVSTRAITVDGADLETDLLPARSAGAVAYGFGQARASVPIDASTNAGNGFVIAQFNPGDLHEDRLYAIHWRLTFSPSQAMAITTRLTYSDDGSYPGAGAAVLSGSQNNVHAVSTEWVSLSSFALIDLGGGAGSLPFRFGIVAMTTDAGSFQVRMTSPHKPQVYLVDLGPRRDATKSLALQNLDDGTSEPEPLQSYKRTWNTSWGRSFNGDGSIYENYGNETNDLYQGYYSGTHGNSRSMIGFNDADIRSRLSGARIQKVQLTFRVKHSYLGAGLDVRIGTHNDSGKPANFHQVAAEVAQRNGVNAGSTVTVTLPNSVGEDLKNGSIRGLTFGPGESNAARWYGYLYGPGSGSAPKLTLTYEK